AWMRAAGVLARCCRSRGADSKRHRMQIFRGKVGTKVSAMAPDRTVFHEAVTKEDLLSGDNVLPSEEGCPVRTNHARRARRRIVVGANGQITQSRETGDYQKDQRTPPPRRQLRIHFHGPPLSMSIEFLEPAVGLKPTSY